MASYGLRCSACGQTVLLLDDKDLGETLHTVHDVGCRNFSSLVDEWAQNRRLDAKRLTDLSRLPFDDASMDNRAN